MRTIKIKKELKYRNDQLRYIRGVLAIINIQKLFRERRRRRRKQNPLSKAMRMKIAVEAAKNKFKSKAGNVTIDSSNDT